MTHFLKIFSFLIFALVFSILGSIVLDKAKAWVEAPAAPPGYGVTDPNNFKPVSRGSADEFKTGRLGVKTDGFDPTFGLTVGKSGQSNDGIKVSGTSYLEDGDFVIEAGRSLCFQTGADCQSSWAGSSYWVKTGNDIYYNTGNVGIGTVSPETLLNLPTSGVIRVGTSVAGRVDLNIDTSGTPIIGRLGVAKNGANEAELSFWTQTSAGAYAERVRIDGDGNVGIGTSTPGAKLQVSGGSSVLDRPLKLVSSAQYEVGEFIGPGYPSLLLTYNGGGTSYISNYNNLGLAFGADSPTWATADMVILNSGNVGIGTVAPEAALHVNGSSILGGEGVNVITGAKQAFPKGSPAYEGGGSWATGGAFWASPMIYRSKRWPDAGGGSFPDNNYGELMLQGTSYGSSYNKGISFITWDGTAADPAIRMRIKEDGNVGIGTTSPGAKLELMGDGASLTSAKIILSETQSGLGTLFLNSARVGSGNRLDIGEGSDVFLTVRSDDDSGGTTSRGNVGIGTTAPGAKLHIQGALSGLLFDGSTSVPEIKSAGSNVDLRLSAVGTGGWVALRTNGTDRLVADATGTVTIGGTLNAGTLQQGGKSVCLSDSTNCPSSTTPNLQAVTTQGSTTSSTITADGFIDWDNASYKIDPDYISTVNQINFTTSGNEAIYSDGSYLYLRSNSTAGGIRLINRSGSSVGYLYGDGSSFGLLTNGGNWAVYMDQSSNWYASSMYDKDNTGYYVNPASGSNMNTVTAATFAGSSRFSITPGSKTYGSLRVDGSGNGYSGIYFADDDRTFMVDSTYQGIYQEGVGWQWYWNNGTLELGSIPWTNLTSYPSDCASGQFVSGVGDTLTCGTPAQASTPSLQAVTDVGKTTTQDITAAAFYVSSDARLKKNVETLSGSLEKLGQVRGVSYDLVSGQSTRQIGVIAQELEQEFPELVTTDGNGYKAVAYDRLSAVLIEAIKELKSQNQILQQRLDQLEKKW